MEDASREPEQGRHGSVDQGSSDEEHLLRLLGKTICAILAILAAICVYFLSLGPVLKYSVQVTTIPIVSNSGVRVILKSAPYPGWVTALYSPAFRMIGPDSRPEYGKHDLVNAYKRYLQKWTP
jgi:hypothetical protein